MAGADVLSVITGMTSDSESSRKLAAYHLQSLVTEPSFADAFVQARGMTALRAIVLEENGNALAYALGSLTRLLELNLGWDHLNSDVMERAVQIVVNRPVINVLRNALLLLVLVVSRPFNHSKSTKSDSPPDDRFGFKALVPLLQVHQNFLDCLVDKLGSADHALCANALHLVNALMRDSVVNGGEDEWPKFINRLQELGVISGVETLMRGDALHEMAGPLLEFQDLMKILFARWREIPVDLEKPEHRRTLKQLHTSSFPAKHHVSNPSDSNAQRHQLKATESKDLDLEKWVRLGFSSENPVADLEEAKFLGMMDLAGYTRKHLDAFQKELLEQSVQPLELRCPISRASLSVTMILYEYFNVASMDYQDSGYFNKYAEQRDEAERLVQPLLLRWEDVHSASLNSFIRLWKESGATASDYRKIEDLTRLLVRTVLGQANRKADIYHVEYQLNNAPLGQVRTWQLQEVEQIYEYAWSQDLKKLREQMHTDALLFMREQRIKCLLQGSWFPIISSPTPLTDQSLPPMDSHKPRVVGWRFVRLSTDRKYLHHASRTKKADGALLLSDLRERIDLDTVSSVDSSVTRSDLIIDEGLPGSSKDAKDTQNQPQRTITRLTIYGNPHMAGELVLLELNTGNASLASEWLDGLLMQLDQQPITADTNKLIDVLEQWSLTIRMLNLQWEDVDWNRARGEQLPVPSRRGLDNNFWYDMGD